MLVRVVCRKNKKISEELQKILIGWAEEIEEDPLKVLEKALDIIYHVEYLDGKRKIVGFDICLGVGEPNIYWIYSRGYHRLEGYWFPEIVEIALFANIAEQVLEYFEEMGI